MKTRLVARLLITFPFPAVFKNTAIVFLLSLLLLSCSDEEPRRLGLINGKIVDESGNLLDSVQCNIVTGAGNSLPSTVNNGIFSLKTEYGTYTANVSRKWYATSAQQINVDKDTVDVVITLNAAGSYLKIADTLLNVSFPNGNKTIELQSNSTWTISSDSPWLTTSTSSGRGSTSLTLSWQASESKVLRSGKITVTAGGLSQNVTVNQLPMTAIVSSQGRIGNKESAVADSVIIQFNTPVRVESIVPKSDFCQPEIKSKVSGTRLSFTYECAALGSQYGFTIKVTDAANNQQSFDVDVAFYTTSKDFEGFIKDYILTSDNKWIWAVTESPNNLLKIAVDGLTIVKSFPLPVNPISLSYNNYSNSFNFFSRSKHCYGCGGEFLYSIDAETGAITNFKMTPIDGYDHPSYPSTFPLSMSMFKNGLGILVSEDDSYNVKMRYIDASQDNTTYIKDDYVGNNFFTTSCMNYDKSLIYLSNWHGTPDIEIMDEAGTLHLFRSPYVDGVYHGIPNFIVPNRLNNRVYVVQLYEQYITDLQNASTKTSFIDTRAFDAASGDFSYRAGEDNVAYLSIDELFQVLDYGNRFTLLSADAYPYLSQLKSTTDGKLLIGIKNSTTAYSSAILLFNLDDLMSNAIKADGTGSRRALPNTWVK